MKPAEVGEFTPDEWQQMVDVLTARAKAQKKAEREARQR